MLRYIASLLTLSSSVGQDKEGQTYALLPNDGDTVPDSSLIWKAFVDLELSGGEGGAVKAEVQTSHDGKHWVTLTTSSALETPGSQSELMALSTLGPYVRARTVIEGDAVYTAKVVLASSASFKLVEV